MTMKPSMLAKLEQLANRLTEIDELLMQPDVASDQDNYRKLSKEHAELGPVVRRTMIMFRFRQMLMRRRKCWPTRNEESHRKRFQLRKGR